ncbi:hypothetical protein ACOBQJ_11790 [Pelotomaculum propionicicum]|uniref:hypothetical protein n=1 Tax=Pelotomaculum propionicicum TaxID=258475 RepID=UPI003B7E531C
MAEEIKGDSVPEDPVIRLLEQTSRYGLDQETMLIYISSVNLMSILGLIGRRYGGNANLSLPLPAALPALPALSPVSPGAAPAGGQSMENLMGIMMKMLGGQGGGSTPAGQGINTATLLNMLSVLGQHVDLNSLMSMMAGMLGSGSKAPPGHEGGGALQPAAGAGQPAAGVKENAAAAKTAGEEKQARREAPKIMKWDPLDDRKKA